MKILPAIDIKNGKCVRLTQGDYNRVTEYGDDPVEVAKKWESQGADIIHIVDLDGAKSGQLINLEVIKKIVASVDIPIQIGGGIRTTDSVENYIDAGVMRVIIGTAAVTQPEWLKEMVAKHDSKICVSIDAINGNIATEGWQNVLTLNAVDYILELESIGVRTIVYTDISKDGMLKGPNFEMYEVIDKKTNVDIIASGGVTTLADVKRLKEIDMYGAIIGKALYDGVVDLKEAIEC